MARERILFVTGRLAETSLRQVLASLSERAGFDYEVAVLGISVAALMHGDWLKRKLVLEDSFDRIILPGACSGELESLSQHYATTVERGPLNLFDLPEHFDQGRRATIDLSRYDIEILAEINHAPRLTDAEILAMANGFRDSGADFIDLGCIPGEPWLRTGDVTRLLRQEGFRVSIDSFEQSEVESAVEAGAELVLSCNSENIEWLAKLDAELVAIPDTPDDWPSLEETVATLSERNVRFRIDPIVEPIGFGFAASLGRYLKAREQWPNAEIMMGIGNLTELCDVDSAGVNFLLAGLCQEQGIRSVLTTQVINWCTTAVQEFDIARRIVRHSVRNRVLPKHIDSSLVMLRDTKVHEAGQDVLDQLASKLTDPNYRILVERGMIHVMNRDGYWTGDDPYEMFDQMAEAHNGELSASHAFYLGYELCKARTALTLQKQYTQDETLRWGMLTVAEPSAIERRKKQKSETRDTSRD